MSECPKLKRLPFGTTCSDCDCARADGEFLQRQTVYPVINDSRPIVFVRVLADPGGQFMVGVNGVTEIVAYHEAGEMGNVTWIAVIDGDEVFTRIPSRFCLIAHEASGGVYG